MKTLTYQSAKEIAKRAALPLLAIAVVVAPDLAMATAATAIDDAITQGETLVGKVAPGLIAIAAIMTGVGLVISWIRK